jgi:hypothetical protein
MHEPNSRTVAGGATVKVYSLNQRTGAIPNADNSDSDFSHSRSYAILSGAKHRGQDAKVNIPNKVRREFQLNQASDFGPANERGK